jgi:hypothetical protein
MTGPSYRVLVTGSRDWDDYVLLTTSLVQVVIDHAAEHDLTGPIDWVTVIHGACPSGADNMADNFCRGVTNWDVERHPADWKRHGKSAGFRRNAEMVQSRPDICLAFIKKGSKGSTHCAEQAEKAGVPTRRYTA